MKVRELAKIVNKIRNVELDNGALVIDDMTKSIYKNTLRELTRLENKYDVDLDNLRSKLKEQYKELQDTVKKSNERGNDRNSLTDVERESGLLTKIEDTIHYLNPERKSDTFKQETLDILKITQKDNYGISEFELDMWEKLTGIDRDTLDEYLYPTGSEEKTWYKIYTELVEQGMTPDEAYVVATEIYEQQKIKGRKIYNMNDIIENFVPNSKKEQARDFLKNVTIIRLNNMKEV